MSEIQPEIELFSVLKSRNPLLASQFELLKKKCLEDWANMLGPDMGSFSGYPHFRNVERNVNQIIPEKARSTMTTGEIFLLLSAVYLHDIGKTFPGNQPKDPNCKNEKDCAHKKSGDASKCEKFNLNHYVLSEKFIKDNGVSLGLPDEKMAEYCGLLAFCHGLDIPPEKDQLKLLKNGCSLIIKKRKNFRVTSISPYGVFRIPLLAAILRIADEADNSWTRAIPKEFFDNNVQYEEDPLNYIKAFRRCIEGVEFCHEGQCLIVHVPENDYLSDNHKAGHDFIEAINTAKRNLELVIHSWTKVLSQIDVEFSCVYIEYNNHLFQDFKIYKDSESYPCLTDVVKLHESRIEHLFEALVTLSFGSYDFDRFSWGALEAQVGDPLHEMDKWLIQKIADYSDDKITIDGEDGVIIHLKRDEYHALQSNILKIGA